jgi:hypothetical protein
MTTFNLNILTLSQGTEVDSRSDRAHQQGTKKPVTNIVQLEPSLRLLYIYWRTLKPERMFLGLNQRIYD